MRFAFQQTTVCHSHSALDLAWCSKLKFVTNTYKMYIYITLVVLPVISNYVRCESTTELPKEVQEKTTLKRSLKQLSSTVDPLRITSTNYKQQQKPCHQKTGKQQRMDDNVVQSFRPSSHLTKLAKSLSLSFEPLFNKAYFGPFERRQRPLKLVAFKKNGLAPKYVIKHDGDNAKSLEVAVQQSPYNSIGHFWQDEPGEPDY